MLMFLFLLLILVFQDSMNALAHDLNYPALRKNKNIEAFLSRCKTCSVFALTLFIAESLW